MSTTTPYTANTSRRRAQRPEWPELSAARSTSTAHSGPTFSNVSEPGHGGASTVPSRESTVSIRRRLPHNRYYYREQPGGVHGDFLFAYLERKPTHLAEHICLQWIPAHLSPLTAKRGERNMLTIRVQIPWDLHAEEGSAKVIYRWLPSEGGEGSDRQALSFEIQGSYAATEGERTFAGKVRQMHDAIAVAWLRDLLEQAAWCLDQEPLRGEVQQKRINKLLQGDFSNMWEGVLRGRGRLTRRNR
jgi:hypothetical protein